MSIPKAEHDELCCVYAGLLLADENLEITADKLNKIIAVSGNQVDGYYPEFFERFFKNVNLNTLLTSIGSAGAGASTGAVAVTAPAKEDPKAAAKGGKEDKKGAKKEEPKKEEAPAEEDAGGFGDLFG
jgi:large subunit ribosomal protein LP1